MSVGAENALLAAIQIATTDASARIQAAVAAASIQATASEDSAQINADAQVQVATIDASARTSVAQIQGEFELQVATVNTAWHVSVANIEAAASVSTSQIRADADTQVASTHATAQTTSATTEANASMTVASTAAAAQESVAAISAAADTTVATTHANATVSSSTLSADAQTASATIQANATIEAATIDAGWHSGVATIEANAQIQAAGIDASWHAQVAEIESAATEYTADQNLAGVKYQTDMTLTLLNLKLAFANDKFSVLLPVIDQALGIEGGDSGGSIGFGAFAPSGPTMGFGGMRSSAAPGANQGMDDFQYGTYSRRSLGLLGGMSRGGMQMGSGDTKSGGIGFASGTSVADAVAATNLPFISQSGALTPSQIQSQVNAAYARNDLKTASEVLNLTNSLTGQGFSANSPIVAALRVGLTSQNLRASVLAEQQIRLESAKTNRDTVLNAQKAASDQFIQQEGVLIDHEKNDVTRTVGILSAISQLVGSAL